tara:strand:+ start:1960 stop:2673 length:714 start_codon:yes stop_codon:yes gene_type:complete
MQMLILAGGFGTRLLDVVYETPKAMAPINGIPLLKFQLEHWIKQGQRDFIFLLYHQADAIIDFLQEQSRQIDDKINILWVVESSPLGTGGAVANAISELKLKGFVLISNADTWLSGGVKKISETEGSALGVVKVDNVSRFGSVSLDRNDYITKFVEKKVGDKQELSGLISAGFYKLPTEIFTGRNNLKFSMERDILPDLVNKKLLKSVMLDGDFFDIGTPDDYYHFCDWFRGKYEIG